MGREERDVAMVGVGNRISEDERSRGASLRVEIWQALASARAVRSGQPDRSSTLSAISILVGSMEEGRGGKRRDVRLRSKIW
jgi:hypothetical protein